MPRQRTGTVYPHGDHFDIRVTLPGGKRSRPMCLAPGLTEEQAREIALRRTKLAEQEAIGLVPKGSADDATAVAGETFEAWCSRWCKAREERGLASVDDDRGRLRKWVFPLWADKSIARLTRDDVEELVEHLDARVRAGDLSWKTAANVWGLITKALSDASRSKLRALRVREDNPAAGVEGPDRGAKKSKVYLYPSEFLKLAACPAVPLRWRRIFAISTYLYLRAAELRGLEWPDLDLEHRDAFVHRSVDDDGNEDTTKGEESRHVAIEPALVPLLVAMKKEAGDRRRVIERMPPEEDLAEKLRHWLRRAGVTREELFVNDKTRKWITFHDLRATGITWRAIRGDDPLKIMVACGHKQFSTTQGYIRAAEQVREGFGDVFPELPPALLGADEGPGDDGAGGEGPSSGSEEEEPLQGDKTPPPSGHDSSGGIVSGRGRRADVAETAVELLAIPAGIEPALPA